MLALLLLLPHVAAGTEQAPELSDPEGDVSYSAAYIGPHDRDHLDLLAAFFSDAPSSQETVVTVKVADYSRIAQALNGWAVYCELRANVTAGGKVSALLRVVWAKDLDVPDFYRVVQLQPVGGTPQNVENKFRMARATPGYVAVAVKTVDVSPFGNAIGDPSILCAESNHSISGSGGLFGGNRDNAAGDGVFVLAEPANTTLDHETPANATVAQSLASGTERGVPHLGWVGTVALLVGAAWISRRQRRT